VNPSNLGVGDYAGSILVSDKASDNSLTISVSLRITAPMPVILQIANAASYSTDGISPGEIVTITGSNLGPTTPVGPLLDSAGRVATSAGGVQILVNGFVAPILYASSTQLNSVIPYEIASSRTANVMVRYLGQTSNGFSVPVAVTRPGIFTADSSGTGPGAILNADGSLNGPDNPESRGGAVVLYLTGEGQTIPAGVTGQLNCPTNQPCTISQLPAPVLSVTARIGGQPVGLTFVGGAPGFVSGLLQINVEIPSDLTAIGTLPIDVTVGDNTTQAGVTVSVR
jgi:uncharacterized protein (TIGR03437 family)